MSFLETEIQLSCLNRNVGNEVSKVNLSSLSLRIVDLREKNGMTQTELADKMGLDKSSMSKIENGSRKVSSDELKKLSRIFSVSADYLLNGVDSKKSAEAPLSKNQKLVAYSIDPDISDEEREAIIQMVQAAKKFRRRI